MTDRAHLTEHRRLPANYSNGHWQGRCSCGWTGEWLATRGATVTAWDAHREVKPVNITEDPAAALVAGIASAREYLAIKARLANDGENRSPDVAPMEQDRMARALVVVAELHATIIARIEAHQECILADSSGYYLPPWIDAPYGDIVKAIKAGKWVT